MPNILPENLVIQRSVPIYGITQLGLRSHPIGSSTLSFIRSDILVFNTVAFRPCYPTQAVAGPIVSHIRYPFLTFPGGVHHFHGHLDPWPGRPHGDPQIAGVWTRSERELHINVLYLFLWLQTQDIALRARHIPVCLNVIAERLSRPNQPIMKERVESPPRSRESDIQTVGNSSSGHVCQSPQHASSPDGRGDTHRLLVAITTMVSTPDMTEC